MRIGANSGSLPKHLLELAQEDTAAALVEEALEQVRLLESMDYHDFKISVKSSSVPTMIRAYRMLSEKVPYPLHLGVTEAGHAGERLDQERDRRRQPAHGRDRRHDPDLAHGRPGRGGQGRLGDPQGARPARARADHDRLPLVRARQRRRREPRRGRRGAAARRTRRPSRSRSWAARSTGPGEAGDADFGIAGGRDTGFIYAHGRVLKKVESDTLVDELFRRDRPLDRGRHGPAEAAEARQAGRAHDGRSGPAAVTVD